jgi:amino acid transporter
MNEPLFLDVRMFHNPGFLPGVQAGTNILLAFTGGPAFYNVLSEMRNPRDFNKSVYLAQTWVTVTYLVISCVIYASVGQWVTQHVMTWLSDISIVPPSGPLGPSWNESAME